LLDLKEESEPDGDDDDDEEGTMLNRDISNCEFIIF
jgi:hypothetical protein